MLKAIILLAFAMSIASAFAADVQYTPKTFQIERGTLKLDVPSGWQTAKGMFGVPLTILGPEQGGVRPIIQAVATGKSVAFDEKKLKSDEDSYREGRRAWVKKYGGTVIGFEGYETTQRSPATVEHKIGVKYQLNGIEYAETSYYVPCADQLYQFKTLMKSDQVSSYGETVRHVVNSFGCAQ